MSNFLVHYLSQSTYTTKRTFLNSPLSPLSRPWTPDYMLEDLLAPATVAAVGLAAMPENVSSVVGNVLDETIKEEDCDYFGNSYKLLNNTAVVEEVAGKFGVSEEERAQLKMELEEQTRDEIQCCTDTMFIFNSNLHFEALMRKHFPSTLVYGLPRQH